MRTVGQILKETRLQKGFALEQVEKATKIRAKFLVSIESDDYKSMPASPYIQGFIRNYSEFLGLKHHTILALFRRQFLQKERQKNQTVEEPLTSSGWQITPNKVITFLVVILVGVLLTYFYFQYRNLHTPPPLEVASPKEEVVTKDEVIAVYGDTDSDATVLVNNDPVLVGEDGKFFKEYPLSLGGNTFVIEAVSRVGEKTTVIREVTRAP